MLKECTPGPWAAERTGYNWQVSDCQNTMRIEFLSEPTARLIAAAPEMALVNWATHSSRVILRDLTHFDGDEWEVVLEFPGDEPMLLILPDNGFNCPALPPDLFARLWAEMEAANG